MQLFLVARPIVNHLLTMRELQKKIDFLKTGVDPDGRIRTSYNISGTNTADLAQATVNLALVEIYRTWRKALEAYSSRLGMEVRQVRCQGRRELLRRSH